MAKLVFEKQTSGYKVRRAVKSEDGKNRWEELGRIVRENNYSKDYKPDVDIDGNVSSYYSKLHAKTNYVRDLEKAVHELQQPWKFVYAKNYNELLQGEDYQQIMNKLLELNSFKTRANEIAEFSEFAKKLLSELNSFTKKELKEQTTRVPKISK